MAAIHVKDDFVVGHPIEVVYQRLHHFQTYDEWWPKQFRVECAPDAMFA
ncbi:hypothetical protein [Mycolicibacterium pyrenivorans]|nr:hypothetical protein [Mycolicibacterium pyrenivorans]MCV7149820.1 hypothetical protein [Mycolicibacterium pyrenivorans]